MFWISAACAQPRRPGLASLNGSRANLRTVSRNLERGLATDYIYLHAHTHVARLDAEFILDVGSFCCANKETQRRR
jgi:hypothetical protein